ncbi:hypothetical protein OURE66S_00643 [Oligella ureolytica]
MKIVEEVELTLRIVDAEEAHQLNRQYRNKDYQCPDL